MMPSLGPTRQSLRAWLEEVEASVLDHPRWDVFAVSLSMIGLLAVQASLRADLDPLTAWEVAERQGLYGTVLTFVSISFGFTTFSIGFFFTSSHSRIALVRDSAGERVAHNFRVVVRSVLGGLLLLLAAYIFEGPPTVGGSASDPRVWPTYIAVFAVLLVFVRLGRIVVLMSHLIRLSGMPPAQQRAQGGNDLVATYEGEVTAGTGVLREGRSKSE